MSAQWTGLAAAAATFAGIWAGHVGVRKIEFHATRLWPPAALLAAGGLGLEALAAFTGASPIAGAGPAAAAWGILGMTLIFDALELFRQFRRVREGRAPANPANPRHAPFLAAGSAVTVDPLEPAGSGEGDFE